MKDFSHAFTEEIDAPKPNGHARPPRRFEATPFARIQVPAGPPALLDDVIFASSLIVVFGESGCGKSFWTSCLALHISAGRGWGGKRTTPGTVAYIAAEGQRGFLKRMVAAREHMGLPISPPFYAICDAPNLGHADGDAAELVARIKEQIPGGVSLVIVDTLARVLGGADESSAADMSTLVTNADAIMRELSCSVLLVHHSGKDPARGARGSSVLRAAADTEVYVEKTDAGCTAKITKQKDSKGDLVMAFDLQPVTLQSYDETSCIVTAGDWQRGDGKAEQRARATGPALVALRALEECLADHAEFPPASTHLPRTKHVVRMAFWRDACGRVQITETDSPDAKRKAFKRAAEKLQSLGFIGVFDEFVWVNK